MSFRFGVVGLEPLRPAGRRHRQRLVHILSRQGPPHPLSAALPVFTSHERKPISHACLYSDFRILSGINMTDRISKRRYDRARTREARGIPNVKSGSKTRNSKKQGHAGIWVIVFRVLSGLNIPDRIHKSPYRAAWDMPRQVAAGRRCCGPPACSAALWVRSPDRF
jgi:hypothetical protein